MRYLIALFLLSTLTLTLTAQPVLRPSIGINALPADGDSVCYIPWYLGSFYASGLQAGDTAFDFTLYNLNGDSLNLASALSQGRPVLLVAGSYTCPVYRNKVSNINDVVNTYGGMLDVYVIYTQEAHPDIDTSVYFGYVNTTTQNIQTGILYRQPTTYGERKNVVADMLGAMNILAPVYIDGPCNNWWSVYGPAPNNAYLINTNGIVFAKHGWFQKFPDNIYCDIDSLLGTGSGNCTVTGGFSNYTFQLTSSDTMYDAAGSTISVDAEFTNTGNQDILVYARRVENDIPQGWASSMCIDVCYSSATDSVVFLLPAGTTQAAHVYFYTSSSSSDTGYVKLRFKNLNDTTNISVMHAFGISTLSTGIIPIEEKHLLTIQTKSSVIFWETNSTPDNKNVIEVFNLSGNKLFYFRNKNNIDLSGISPGLYFIRVNDQVKKLIVQE